MKALLRSSILALVVFAGFAAFSSAQTSFSLPTIPAPTCPQASLR
jgi:hypothetical protein